MDRNATRTEEKLQAVDDAAPWSAPSPEDDEPVLGRRGWMRIAWVFATVVLLILLVTLPPLVNVNRYRRGVTQAISGAIGRPVHLDNITLHLLPLPGFTIQNFVVQEDPAFGAEPAMRANVVEARVRFASLWRRRIEISRIRLENPSVNLVRRADGAWNLQGVIAQAGQLQSAPTAQAKHGDAPRFPYVEAKGARINIKLGTDKLPYSLVDAKFALWLPSEREWRLRLEGRPLRTDTDVSDVGDLRVEGTLGRSGGTVANEQLALSARLSSTPMGEAAKLVVGRDLGWRGAASAEIKISGTPAAMLVTTDLHLHNLRRAEFVPRLPMSVDAHCQAQAMGVLHQLHDVRCAIPTAQSTSLLDAVDLFKSEDEHVLSAPDILSVRAEVPNALDWRSAKAEVQLQRGSPEWVLNWLRLFSTRIPESENVGGTIELHASKDPASGGGQWSGIATCECVLPPVGEVQPAKGGHSTAPEAKTEPEAHSTWTLRISHLSMEVPSQDVLAVSAAQMDGIGSSTRDDVAVSSAFVAGQLSQSGYTLQYGSAKTAAFAASLLPTLGDSMPAEPSGPMQSERAWGGPQVWTAAATSTPVRATKRPARRR